ncbi:MAG: hypothetical protein AAFW84_26270 [Cyanobacteria bacterium J06635_15]
MDDFYESQEYAEIAAEAQTNSLLEFGFGQPGGKVGGSGLFVGLLLIAVGAGLTLKAPRGESDS